MTGRHSLSASITWVAALVVSVTALPAVAFSQEPHAGGHADIGIVDFRVGCAAEVRQEFDRSVALLHHMMYERAQRAFEAIAERDSSCAMAHWGIAMTHFQPLWHSPTQAAVRAGWKAIQRAKALGAESPRDSALIAATAAFFEQPDEAQWWPRVRRWADAMAQAHARAPDDVETAAFYALSQLAAGQPAEDRLAYNARAARTLLAIHERQPKHPGASHYTIHANDVTGRADQSLAIVRGYDDIAPSVPHALHMPTHILVRLGDWPGTIEWNRKSAAAALEYPAGDRYSLHYPHAMAYLLHAHLQRGQDAIARAVLDTTLAKAKYEENFASAFHLAEMPARLALERRDWAAAAAIEPRTPAYVPWDRFAWPEAISWFARGMGAVHAGDLAAAATANERMGALRDAMRNADEQAFATYIETDRRILAGTMALLRGDTAQALAELTEAARLEGTVQKHPVTPGTIYPANEALGDLLMAIGRPRPAIDAYRAALSAEPNRYRSILGLARAADQAGDRALAAQQYRELLALVAEGSEARAGVREAKEKVAVLGGR